MRRELQRVFPHQQGVESRSLVVFSEKNKMAAGKEKNQFNLSIYPGLKELRGDWTVDKKEKQMGRH